MPSIFHIFERCLFVSTPTPLFCAQGEAQLHASQRAIAEECSTLHCHPVASFFFLFFCRCSQHECNTSWLRIRGGGGAESFTRSGERGEKREKPTQTNVSEGGKSCTKKEGAGERKIPRKGKKVGSKAVLLARN